MAAIWGACTSAEPAHHDGNGPDAVGVPNAMPGLEELPLAAPAEDLEPERSALTGMLLSDVGEFAYQRTRPGPGEYVWVSFDSSGAHLADFGIRGEGPGEVQTGGFPFSDGARILLVYPKGFVRFRFDGTQIDENRNAVITTLPRAVVGDSIDLVPFPSPSHKGYAKAPITRRCLVGDCERELLRAGHPVMDEVMAALPAKASVNWPPYAAVADRFVLADGNNYHLWTFNSRGELLYQFGRELPLRYETAAELAGYRSVFKPGGMVGGVTPKPASTAARQLPHFSAGAIWFDVRDRLWVIGQQDGATFLDVFQDSVFLGRRLLDCDRSANQSVALQGRWVAAICRDESIDAGQRVRLFRIVENNE